MSLIDRWRAKESKVGKFLKREFFILLAALSAFSHLGLDQQIATKLMNLPPDYVPEFVKWTLTGLTFLSPIAGKMTVECPEKPS